MAGDASLGAVVVMLVTEQRWKGDDCGTSKGTRRFLFALGVANVDQHFARQLFSSIQLEHIHGPFRPEVGFKIRVFKYLKDESGILKFRLWRFFPPVNYPRQSTEK